MCLCSFASFFLPFTHRSSHYRAKEVASDAPSAVQAAVVADASDVPAASSITSLPSTKRPRDDEPCSTAAAAVVSTVGAAAKQKLGDGTVWDWVRVHRVGAAGKCVTCRVVSVVGRCFLFAPLRIICLISFVPVQAHAAPGCVCRARLLLYFPKCVMHRHSMLLARHTRHDARIRQAFVLSLVLRCSCCWCRVLLRVTGVLVSTERASAKHLSLHSDFPPYFF